MLDRLIASLPLLTLLVAAARLDLRRGRIPNELTIAIAGLGVLRAVLLYAAVGAGAHVAGVSVLGSGLGMLTGIGLTIVFFLVGAMGGGDVKLMAGVGAWLGPVATIEVFAIASILGMCLAIAQCASQGKTLVLARSSAVALGNLMFVSKSKFDGLTDARRDCPTVGHPLPYAVPVMVATLLIVAGLRAW